jgi:hypothetical protein
MWKRWGGHREPPVQMLCPVFDLGCLGGDTDDDVIRLDVARDHRAGADQRVVTDLDAGENGGVVCEADVVSNPGLGRIDLVDVVDIVIVRIDVCVI